MEYVQIDGKYVWASREELVQARELGILDDEEGLAEEQYGGEQPHEDQ